MIVKDFEKGIRPDHEPTVAHYEALLAEKGVKGVKERQKELQETIDIWNQMGVGEEKRERKHVVI